MRGYRKYRLSGELCPTGSGAITGAMREELSNRQLHSLRSLASGYECLALRAVLLRDGVPLPYGESLHLIIYSSVKLSMASPVSYFMPGESC